MPPDPHPLVHVGLERNAGRLRQTRDRTWRAATGTDPTAHLHWALQVETPLGWRTGLVDTLLHLADCVPEAWFVAALDAAVHRPRAGRPLLTEDRLALLAEHLPQRLRPALALIDDRSESCIETLIRLGLSRRGVDGVELQVWVAPAHRVDLLLRGRLVIEVDGAQFHDPVRDALRDAELRSRGFMVLRFSYDRIVHDLEAVLDEVEAALLALEVA